MVGKHLKKILPNAIYLSSSDCNLISFDDTFSLFQKYKPEVVIHLAAKVGGIMDNINNPVSFFEDNIYINTNILKCCFLFKVEKMTALLSTCIYPDVLSEDQYPIKEKYLHLGPPAKTNFSYGYAKRCLAVQIKAYNEQYGTKYSTLTPCNLYSEYDHFEGDKAHFLSSLIYKINNAKLKNCSFIELFGSGKPLRQFMYAEDVAKVIKFTLDKSNEFDYNVCNPQNLSIKEIAEIALISCNASNLEIKWDINKPDGQFRKDASSEKLLNDYPNFKFTNLINGIKKTYNEKFNQTLET